MHLSRSRSTRIAPAERVVQAGDSACECRCDPQSQEEACLSSSPQRVLVSQKHQRERDSASTPHRWRFVPSGVLFVLACLTNPCCTPIIVPLVLSLIAGTPAVFWLTQHGGWIYGVLTGISLLRPRHEGDFAEPRGFSQPSGSCLYGCQQLIKIEGPGE